MSTSKLDRRVTLLVILLIATTSVAVSAFAFFGATAHGQQFVCYGLDPCRQQCAGANPRFSWCPKRGEPYRHLMGMSGCLCSVSTPKTVSPGG